MDLQRKLTSRKFWLCVAAFLASIATSVAGLQSSNEVIATVGVVCSMISAGIYAVAEAYVDAAHKKDGNEANESDQTEDD